MNKLKVFLFIFIFSSLSASCSKQIENFVDIKRPKNPPNSNPSDTAIKYSGGAAKASGSQVDTMYSIGYKDRKMSGSQVDTSISISTYRPSLTQ